MIEDDKLEHSDINVQFPNGLSITSQASLGFEPMMTVLFSRFHRNYCVDKHLCRMISDSDSDSSYLIL